MNYKEFLETQAKLARLEKAYMQAWKTGKSKKHLARLARQLIKLDNIVTEKQGYIYY